MSEDQTVPDTRILATDTHIQQLGQQARPGQRGPSDESDELQGRQPTQQEVNDAYLYAYELGVSGLAGTEIDRRLVERGWSPRSATMITNDVIEELSRAAALPSDWAGGISLVCACTVWVGTCLITSGELGGSRLGLAYTETRFLALVACLFVATLGGAFTGIGQGSKAGRLALLLGALYMLTWMTCVSLLAGSWPPTD